MGVKSAEVMSFIESQIPKQQRHFGAQLADKFLAYVGSTREAGAYLDVSAHRLLGIEGDEGAADMRVRLGGRTPVTLKPKEIATVCAWQQYVGYQLKTRTPVLALGNPVEAGAGDMVVKCAQVYTLHHTPYTLNAFEKVPVEEVVGTVRAARFALVGVGVQANLSPRFCFHHEEVDGRIALFHGDGLPMKTYHNVKVNPRVTRVVLDPETFAGYVAHGVLEEVAPADHPQAHAKVCAGFAAGGWGRPARMLRFVAEDWTRLTLAN